MANVNNEIYWMAKNRDVEYLVHFTKMSNLQSILKNGLLPNDAQKKNGVIAFRNDSQRLDYTDATCLSVSFPNYKLFYRFREKFEDDRWVVLLLNPELLNNHRCAFSYKNAASSEIASKSVNSMMGANAFLKMFAEPDDWRTRDKMQTAPNETTDPQAEVLVFDRIEPQYISEIVFQTEEDLKKSKRILPRNLYSKMYLASENLYYSSTRGRFVSYFDRRPDFRYWRY